MVAMASSAAVSWVNLLLLTLVNGSKPSSDQFKMPLSSVHSFRSNSRSSLPSHDSFVGNNTTRPTIAPEASTNRGNTLEIMCNRTPSFPIQCPLYLRLMLSVVCLRR